MIAKVSLYFYIPSYNDLSLTKKNFWAAMLIRKNCYSVHTVYREMHYIAQGMNT